MKNHLSFQIKTAGVLMCFLSFYVLLIRCKNLNIASKLVWFHLPTHQAMVKPMRILLLFTALLVSISTIGQEVTDSKNIEPLSDANMVWKKAGITTAGGNSIYGVSVFFRRIQCNSMEIVLLKFINENDEDVQIEWADGIIVPGKEWIHNERIDKVRNLKLKANTQIEGSCKDKSDKSLRFELDQYIDDPELSFRYTPSYLDVTKQ